jgi:alkylhydroperoxidase family enzyme
MAFIQPDPSAKTDGHVQAMYERQAEAFGYLPNYAVLFSHRPEVIDLWAELQRGLRRHVGLRLFELVTFAAAVELKSSYCALAHGCKLRGFFSDAEIERLAGGEYEGVVEADEAAAMHYAAAVAADASGVTEAHVAPMRAVGFSDREIFDVAGVAAGRAFFSKLVEGLGALPDRAYLDLPESFRSALEVGRATESAEAAAPLQSG